MPKGVPRFPVMLETEKTLIGTLLRNEDLAEIITAELEPDDFYDFALQSAYKACRSILDESGTLSPVAVHGRSNVDLAQLEDICQLGIGVTEKQVRTLMAELRRVSTLRKTYDICKDVGASIHKDAKVEQVLDLLEKGIYRLDRQGSNEPVDGGEVLDQVVQSFLEREKTGGGPIVSTGLLEVDKAIIGLGKGKLIVLAGRPSMGKTALADTIRRNVVSQGYGAIEFSLEMSKEETCEREIAFRAQTNLRKVCAAKNLTDEERDRVRAVSGRSNTGLWFIDDNTYTIAGIRRRARIVAGRMARKGIKPGIIILDYIQLCGGDDDSDSNRERLVAAVSRGCKLMAKELDCSVVALSQLNRGCESREDKRPLMSDLRESGAIEQDADIVAFVYREHMYDTSFPPNEAELIIRKQRSGPPGTVKLKYNEKLVAFEN